MDFEQTVVRYASPALCGIKPGSLFSLPAAFLGAQGRTVVAAQRQIALMRKRMLVTLRNKRTALFFVYDQELLECLLLRADSSSYLAQRGYPVTGGTEAVLRELMGRLRCQAAFPHEVGLFLGYPLADVLAFERDAGRSAKRTAAWQVYGNVEEAERTERMYRECSRCCAELWQSGRSLPDICRCYRESHPATAH